MLSDNANFSNAAPADRLAPLCTANFVRLTVRQFSSSAVSAYATVQPQNAGQLLGGGVNPLIFENFISTRYALYRNRITSVLLLATDVALL